MPVVFVAGEKYELDIFLKVDRYALQSLYRYCQKVRQFASPSEGCKKAFFPQALSKMESINVLSFRREFERVQRCSPSGDLPWVQISRV